MGEKEKIYFTRTVIKAGDTLMVTIPKSLQDRFPYGALVRVELIDDLKNVKLESINNVKEV